jgi:hypothetical protein
MQPVKILPLLFEKVGRPACNQPRDIVMNAESLKEAIRQELPALLRTDPELRAFILELTRREYAGREETQDRFYELLAELRRDREEQTRKWEEQTRKWDEN